MKANLPLLCTRFYGLPLVPPCLESPQQVNDARGHVTAGVCKCTPVRVGADINKYPDAGGQLSPLLVTHSVTLHD